MEQQSRLQSWVFWSSLAAQIVSLLVLFGVFNAGQTEMVNQAIAIILQMFVVFGVLNNPTSKNTL